MSLVKDIIKYALEGLAVGIVAFYVTGKRANIMDAVKLGLVAGAMFMVLDLMAPSIGKSSRQGAGFGVGWNLTGGSHNKHIAPSHKESMRYAQMAQPEGHHMAVPEGHHMAVPEGHHMAPPEAHHMLTPETRPLPVEHVSVDDNPALVKTYDQRHPQWPLIPTKPEDVNQPYYVHPGQYADRIVMPGYNERVQTYNEIDNLYTSEPAPWHPEQKKTTLPSTEAELMMSRASGVEHTVNYPSTGVPE